MTRTAAQIAGRAEVRDPATGLNRTEAAFFNEVLRPLELAGAVVRIDYEPEGLRVAPKGAAGVYWPDFRVQWADGIVSMLEVKGHWLDDARAKIKAAAALHPYTFYAVQRRPKRQGGGWSVETIGEGPDWADRIDTLTTDPSGARG